jgi:hypothetical protein
MIIPQFFFLQPYLTYPMIAKIIAGMLIEPKRIIGHSLSAKP